MLKAVLFDCDGVVVDSETVYLASVCDHLAELGVRVAPSEIGGLVGMRTERILATQRSWFPELAPLSDEEILTRQRALFAERQAREGLPLMPGIDRVLQALDGKGVARALVSSSPRSYLDAIISENGLDGLFSVIVSGEEVRESKPDPEIYLTALERLGTTAENAVAVEDSPNGIAAALAAGLDVVGFKGSSLSLDTSRATVGVRSHEELGRYLSERTGE